MTSLTHDHFCSGTLWRRTLHAMEGNVSVETGCSSFLHSVCKHRSVSEGWRNGSGFKSTGCSCRGPGFDSQHPHGSSQVCASPVPGDLMPSSGLHRPCRHRVYRHTCRQNTHTHKMKEIKSFLTVEAPVCPGHVTGLLWHPPFPL